MLAVAPCQVAAPCTYGSASLPGDLLQPRCIIWSAMAGIFRSLMWRANAWTANAADDDLDMDTCQLNTFFGVLKQVRCMWWVARCPAYWRKIVG